MLLIICLLSSITLAKMANAAEFKHLMPSGIELNLANEYKTINELLERVVPNDDATTNMAVILEWMKSDDMDFFNNIPLQEALLMFSSLQETEGSIRCTEQSYNIIGENHQWISRMPNNDLNLQSRIRSVFEKYARKHAEYCSQ